MAPEFLRGRFHVLNDTIENAFQPTHTGFHPERNSQPVAILNG